MTLRLKALRSLRWNYRWRGVWAWLKGRQRCRCPLCEGDGQVCKNFSIGAPGRPEIVGCPRCDGDGEVPGPRGCRRILSEPGPVIAEQTQLAEGVFV